jgi:hypothetical protein
MYLPLKLLNLPSESRHRQHYDSRRGLTCVMTKLFVSAFVGYAWHLLPSFHNGGVASDQTLQTKTPWPLVRKRTIPTERPPLVDEIQCQLLWIEGCCVVSAADPLRSLIQFSRPEPLLFFEIAHLSSQGLTGPRCRPTATQKIW